MWQWITMNMSWAWLIAGVVLFILEFVAPGIFLLWIGLAAIVTGVLTFAVDLILPVQLMIFALLSVIFAYVGSRFYDPKKIKSDRPELNDPFADYIGREVQLVTNIENGRGKAKVGDSVWTVAGTDMPSGSKVRIISGTGNVLSVVAV